MSVRKKRAGVGAFLAVVATLAVVGALAGPSIALRLKHPRDETAFRTELLAYIGAWRDSRDPDGPARDTAWAAANPDIALAEGNRACAWLADQPDAPAGPDPSGRLSQTALQTRWLTASGDAVGPLSAMGRTTLVAGAWSHLCWWDLHEKSAPLSAQED